MATRTRFRLPGMGTDDERTLDALREVGRPLAGDADLDPLIDRVGEARVVMLGEASHGTSEYYVWRHRISERLIREKGFNFIAVEGDWPDCYEVNRYVRGLDGPDTPREVLKVFERWPTWMWANEEVAALVRTLEVINDALPAAERVGFYGLDVYSLWDSLHAVLGYARKNAPEALDKVREAYRCFEPFGDIDDYARAATWGLDGCEDKVAAMLAELRARRRDDASDDPEAAFDAEQNALVVRNAENYYRIMMRGGGESWNVRDRHMAETLDRLLDRHGPQAKAIVWEHNTHIGDARATDMARAGMVNIGQLARERYARDDVVLVGFGSYRGTVIAGDQWEAPMERMPVPEARNGSWEDLMHRAFGGEDQLLVFKPEDKDSPLHERRGHRAIGVVYHPEYEGGNYVPTDLASRYDAFLYLDETQALHPLHVPPHWERGEHEVPETYPTGM
ncbi:MAG TPA: erythromycin esterase family protein [Planctomycetaceae bacterium]